MINYLIKAAGREHEQKTERGRTGVGGLMPDIRWYKDRNATSSTVKALWKLTARLTRFNPVVWFAAHQRICCAAPPAKLLGPTCRDLPLL
jgi:hypothetical protein